MEPKVSNERELRQGPTGALLPPSTPGARATTSSRRPGSTPPFAACFSGPYPLRPRERGAGSPPYPGRSRPAVRGGRCRAPPATPAYRAPAGGGRAQRSGTESAAGGARPGPRARAPGGSGDGGSPRKQSRAGRAGPTTGAAERSRRPCRAARRLQRARGTAGGIEFYCKDGGRGGPPPHHS